MSFRVRVSGLHLLISVGIAMLSGLLVFWIWYPPPYATLAGGLGLFAMLVGIDVVLGPTLTLLVAAPTKPHAELQRDISLIVVLQLLAFGYGMHTIAMARPVHMVFEVDRFRVVSFADLDEADAALAPDQVQPWGFSRPQVIGIRAAASPEEAMASMNSSLQGIEPSQRPSWWQAYALSVPQVLARAHPVAKLKSKYPDKRNLLDGAIAVASADVQKDETTNPEKLLWLPLVSRKNMDWVVMLDPVTARIRGYANVDGFD